MLRDATWGSSIALQRANTIGCRPWPVNCCAAKRFQHRRSRRLGGNNAVVLCTERVLALLGLREPGRVDDVPGDAPAFDIGCILEGCPPARFAPVHGTGTLGAVDPDIRHGDAPDHLGDVVQPVIREPSSDNGCWWCA